MRIPFEIPKPQGLVAFYLQRGEYQTQLRFGGTRVRIWAAALSVIALVSLLTEICLARDRVSRGSQRFSRRGVAAP